MTHAPSSSPSPQTPFQPFRCLPMLDGHHSWRSRRLLFLLPLLLLAATMASVREETFGSVADFMLLDDIRRVFRIGNPEPSPPEFPFIRDLPSWFLATVIVLTCVLVHRQWTLMQECLPKLISNGVLVPRAQAVWSSLHRRLGMERLVNRHSLPGAPAGATAFDVFVDALNERWCGLVARANVPLFAGAVLLVGFVILNVQQNGVFEVLAPPGQDATEREEWLTEAYNSWWAATPHVLGLTVYAAAGTLGIFIVLLQNAVGIACVYLGVAMPGLATFGANWDDPEECYGWGPLSRMYRTVYWSLMLHGGTLSMLLIVLGVRNFRWLAALVLLWTAAIPLYTVVPWAVFRAVRREAIRARIEEIHEGLADDLAREDLSDTQKLEARRIARDEKKAVAKARITPLRLPKRQIPAFVVTVLFPVVLAVFQLWFSLQFGSK